MRRFRTKVAEWLFAAVVTAFLLFMAGGLVCALDNSGLGSSEAAGWMQAIGSLVAIGIAIWIAGRQQKAAAEQLLNSSYQQRAQFVRSLVLICTWALGFMSKALEHARDPDTTADPAYIIARLDHMREMMEKYVNHSESFGSTIALIYVNALWEARECIRVMPDDRQRIQAANILQRSVAECSERYDQIQAYQVDLQQYCQKHGVSLM